MAVWSVLSAPLLMSNNLATIAPELRQVLLNRKVIAVDQDELGVLGKRLFNSSSEQIWVKPMTPVTEGKASWAIVYLNLEENERIVSAKLLSVCSQKALNYHSSYSSPSFHPK